MVDHEMLLRQLVSAPRITFATLKDAPALQGAYVLWLAGNPVVCLKVGIAGPRGGKGLKGRLSFHFRSDTRNSILAKHLASDATSPWAKN